MINRNHCLGKFRNDSARLCVEKNENHLKSFEEYNVHIKSKFCQKQSRTNPEMLSGLSLCGGLLLSSPESLTEEFLCPQGPSNLVEISHLMA